MKGMAKVIIVILLIGMVFLVTCIPIFLIALWRWDFTRLFSFYDDVFDPIIDYFYE